LFTAVVRVTGAGRIQDFQERLRWLMVRDDDAEDYTEHHAGGTLEYRFQPKRGIPFPAFTTASADFPELRVEAEWQRLGAALSREAGARPSPETRRAYDSAVRRPS